MSGVTRDPVADYVVKSDRSLSLSLSFLSGVLTQLVRSRCHFEKVYKEEKANPHGEEFAVRGVARDYGGAATQRELDVGIVKTCGPPPPPPPLPPLPFFSSRTNVECRSSTVQHTTRRVYRNPSRDFDVVLCGGAMNFGL